MTTPRPLAIRALAPFAACLLLLGVIAAACSDGTDSAVETDTVTLAEWVDRFDRACIGTADTLSESHTAMSDAEFAAFNTGALTALGALKPPDEKADIAQRLLDDMRASHQPGLDDDHVAVLDQRVFDAMTELGISDQCIGGVPG